jgi:hypothetical protein
MFGGELDCLDLFESRNVAEIMLRRLGASGYRVCRERKKRQRSVSAYWKAIFHGWYVRSQAECSTHWRLRATCKPLIVFDKSFTDVRCFSSTNTRPTNPVAL